jgi:hypothetical protein
VRCHATRVTGGNGNLRWPRMPLFAIFPHVDGLRLPATLRLQDISLPAFPSQRPFPRLFDGWPRVSGGWSARGRSGLASPHLSAGSSLRASAAALVTSSHHPSL